MEFRAARKKYDVLYAGNFDGILKREKHAFLSAFFGRHIEQIFAFINHFALRDFVFFTARQHLRQRAFAGAVEAHNRVRFSGINRQIDAAQNLCLFDSRVQITNF